MKLCSCHVQGLQGIDYNKTSIKYVSYSVIDIEYCKHVFACFKQPLIEAVILKRYPIVRI